jgi:D-lyxose ketol-isomerase
MPNSTKHRLCPKSRAISLGLALITSIPATTAFATTQLHKTSIKPRTQLSLSTVTPIKTTVGNRIQINDAYPGLKRVHTNPDVFIIENFLDASSCQNLIDKAQEKGTSRSPVAYAGWTDDIKDLLGLAASGPVTWFAILGAWYESQGEENASVLSLVMHSIRNYAGLFVAAAVLIAGFTKWRANGLQNLRTSSSTTLDDLSQFGAKNFVSCASDLFAPSPSSKERRPAAYFEAPTVIRYEKDQSLAPHYDANRSADVEDKNRGGQTLATLIVYLNDVRNGGTTRFGKLPATDDTRQVKGEPNLNIIPKMGDALLFFPADQNGLFDERTEHEGCPAVDEKWIARIWRHAGRVNPPFGLSDDSMEKYL